MVPPRAAGGHAPGVATHAGLAPFPPQVLDRSVEALTGAHRAVGRCDDYRAAATIDREHDRSDRAAGRRITAPLPGWSAVVRRCRLNG